jgi:agmatinase
LNFLDLPAERSDPEQSRVVVLPLPYEGTVSFGSGTSRGPDAILAASAEVEFWDDELGREPCEVGIHTAEALPLAGLSPAEARERVRAEASRWVERDRLLVALGGEHAVSPPVVEAVRARHGAETTALVIDAHLDLRDSYQGSRDSHACASRRMHEGGPVVIVGARAFERAEIEFAREAEIPVFLARDLAGRDDWIDAVVDACGEQVHVSFDVDGLDPAIVPATGTPVPGGLRWYDALRLLCSVARSRRIVGLDVVELAPIEGLVAPDFLVAQLTYKLIGYAIGSHDTDLDAEARTGWLGSD